MYNYKKQKKIFRKKKRTESIETLLDVYREGRDRRDRS